DRQPLLHQEETSGIGRRGVLSDPDAGGPREEPAMIIGPAVPDRLTQSEAARTELGCRLLRQDAENAAHYPPPCRNDSSPSCTGGRERVSTERMERCKGAGGIPTFRTFCTLLPGLHPSARFAPFPSSTTTPVAATTQQFVATDRLPHYDPRYSPAET